MSGYQFIVVRNLVIFIELLIAEMLFARTFKKRRLWGVGLISSIAVGVGIAALLGLFAQRFLLGTSSDFLTQAWVSLVTVTVISIWGLGTLWAIFDENFSQILTAFIAGYSAQTAVFALYIIVAKSIGEHAVLFNFAPVSLFKFSLYFGIYIPIYICLFFLFRRMVIKDKTIYTDRYVRALVIPMLLVSVFLVRVSEVYNTESLVLYITASVGQIIASSLILGILFLLSERVRLLLERQTLSYLRVQEREQYEISKEAMDAINLKYHDLKHQLKTMKTNQVVSPEFVKELEKNIAVYDARVLSGNEPLDVILSEKSLRCERRNIQFACIADGEKLAFIAPHDLYSLFGNALDNAIEAVEQVPEKNKRFINVSIKCIDQIVAIHLENSFVGKISFLNGLPKTTKKDSRFHGYGVKSMKRTVDKYLGNLRTSTDGDIFNLDIIIPLPKTSEKAKS